MQGTRGGFSTARNELSACKARMVCCDRRPMLVVTRGLWSQSRPLHELTAEATGSEAVRRRKQRKTNSSGGCAGRGRDRSKVCHEGRPASSFGTQQASDKRGRRQHRQEQEHKMLRASRNATRVKSNHSIPLYTMLESTVSSPK